MRSLSVMVSSSVPVGVRGALNQWMVEVLPGVYVGRLTARVRELLWESLVDALLGEEKPYAALITQAPTEQGYLARTVGDHRYALTDFDGLQLVTVARNWSDPESRAPAGLRQDSAAPDPW
ncbi:type I-E CRISPR-associated endoribonuclease Cas2e [Nocardioides yefusunii]|uniref:Type I-E CRISPR-associated endoribonuclease Cas2e n=1 Tax=Nocardioides yefusunii TaxID=2500546 RepID=A0ABW1R005_9ACTN|nr:type I-E CRISPR-associated endoribonuclease Cas2e [Nocardioides yefusunii]